MLDFEDFTFGAGPAKKKAAVKAKVSAPKLAVKAKVSAPKPAVKAKAATPKPPATKGSVKAQLSKPGVAKAVVKKALLKRPQLASLLKHPTVAAATAGKPHLAAAIASSPAVAASVAARVKGKRPSTKKPARGAKVSTAIRTGVPSLHAKLTLPKHALPAHAQNTKTVHVKDLPAKLREHAAAQMVAKAAIQASAHGTTTAPHPTDAAQARKTIKPVAAACHCHAEPVMRKARGLMQARGYPCGAADNLIANFANMQTAVDTMAQQNAATSAHGRRRTKVNFRKGILARIREIAAKLPIFHPTRTRANLALIQGRAV